MKARVFVTLKSGVLDPAGQAVEKNLLRLGFDGVSGVRIGKMVELTLDPKSASSKAEAEKIVAKNVRQAHREYRHRRLSSGNRINGLSLWCSAVSRQQL